MAKVKNAWIMQKQIYDVGILYQVLDMKCDLRGFRMSTPEEAHASAIKDCKGTSLNVPKLENMKKTTISKVVKSYICDYCGVYDSISPQCNKCREEK